MVRYHFLLETERTHHTMNATDTNLALGIVFPEGPEAIGGKELGGDYFKAAGPVIEKQVARAGYRMAAWLDRIAAEAIGHAEDTWLNEL